MSGWREEEAARRAAAEAARRELWGDGKRLDQARGRKSKAERLAGINEQLSKSRAARLAADEAAKLSDTDARRMRVRSALFDEATKVRPDFEWTAEGRVCRGGFEELVVMVGPAPAEGSVRVSTAVGWYPVTLNRREIAPGVTVVWWGSCSAVIGAGLLATGPGGQEGVQED